MKFYIPMQFYEYIYLKFSTFQWAGEEAAFVEQFVLYICYVNGNVVYTRAIAFSNNSWH